MRAIQDEGAYHYFRKTVDANKLRVVLDRALNLMKREGRMNCCAATTDHGTFGEMVGNSTHCVNLWLVEQFTLSASV